MSFTHLKLELFTEFKERLEFQIDEMDADERLYLTSDSSVFTSENTSSSSDTLRDFRSETEDAVVDFEEPTTFFNQMEFLPSVNNATKFLQARKGPYLLLDNCPVNPLVSQTDPETSLIEEPGQSTPKVSYTALRPTGRRLYHALSHQQI